MYFYALSQEPNEPFEAEGPQSGAYGGWLQEGGHASVEDRATLHFTPSDDPAVVGGWEVRGQAVC